MGLSWHTGYPFGTLRKTVGPWRLLESLSSWMPQPGGQGDTQPLTLQQGLTLFWKAVLHAPCSSLGCRLTPGCRVQSEFLKPGTRKTLELRGAWEISQSGCFVCQVRKLRPREGKKARLKSHKILETELGVVPRALLMSGSAIYSCETLNELLIKGSTLNELLIKGSISSSVKWGWKSYPED